MLIAIVASLAAWFVLRPDRPDAVRGPRPENASAPTELASDGPTDEDPSVRPLEVMAAVEGEEAPKEPSGNPNVVMPEGVPHTATCRLIAGWAQRRVPHYTILDNIRDRSMRFTEDDRICLEAARDVPPIVVRFAKRYKKSSADLR
ncbi:MAG: hypothetical protein AAF602_11400 [Myxococcota bacterium]